jgi:hypothetical protein
MFKNQARDVSCYISTSILFDQLPTFHEIFGKIIDLRTFDLKILKELQNLSQESSINNQ